MRKTKIKLVFGVTESCSNYCDFLCLERGPNLPKEGLLVFPTKYKRSPRALFATVGAARRAINRTKYYVKAFGLQPGAYYPDVSFCGIAPLELPQVEDK